MQLAVRAPQTYRNFVDISGEDEPRLGSRQQTVNAAFGGDHAAFARVNPLDIMATTRFPGTSGLIITGDKDREFLPLQRKVYDASARAGMDVRWREVSGAHNWVTWRTGLELSMPWLATRTGMVRE